MAFAAPMVEGVASGAAASEGAAAAGATRAAGSKAAGRAAGVSMPTKTAAARADELVKAGGGRGRSRRALMDEYGATAGQADDLLDAAGTRNPPAPDPEPADTPPDTSSRPSGPSLPSLPRSVTNGAAAGGGLILGTFAYVLALVYLRGGSAGLRAWLRAKFLNKTTSSDHSTTAVTPGVGNAGSGFTLITGGGAGAAGAGVAGSPTPSTKNSGGGW